MIYYRDEGVETKNEEAGEMAFSDEQMMVIQNAIEDLLAKQMGATRAPAADTSESVEESLEQTEVKCDDVLGDKESGDEGDDDGFLVGFPQKLVK